MSLVWGQLQWDSMGTIIIGLCPCKKFNLVTSNAYKINIFQNILPWQLGIFNVMLHIYFHCQFCKGSLMKVHYPKLYNMAHLLALALNVLLLPKDLTIILL